MIKTALIDGDILVYRTGYTTDRDEKWVARARINETIYNILRDTGVSDYYVWLTDSESNFRLQLYPEYKANRTQPKPLHYDYLKEVLVTEHNARFSFGQEADDCMGIQQTQLNPNSCICSIDKDLKQIAGMHYDFVNKEFIEVSPEQGLKFFYKQLLTGDMTDNIPGIPRVGEVTASKILGLSFLTEKEYFMKVFNEYIKYKAKALSKDNVEFSLEDHGKVLYNWVHLMGMLLKIRTQEEEEWQPPVSYETALKLLSTPS